MHINYIQQYTQLFVSNNQILSAFNSTRADILWSYGESEAFITMLSGSTYIILQFVVFFVFLLSYPDDDSKRDLNMLVINNMR